jgi:hypothetical protein
MSIAEVFVKAIAFLNESLISRKKKSKEKHHD